MSPNSTAAAQCDDHDAAALREMILAAGSPVHTTVGWLLEVVAARPQFAPRFRHRFFGHRARRLARNDSRLLEDALAQHGLSVFPPLDGITLDAKVVVYISRLSHTPSRAHRVLSEVHRFFLGPGRALIAAIATVASIYGGYVLIRPHPPTRLDGDLNIAVVRVGADKLHSTSGALEDSLYRVLARGVVQDPGPLEIKVGSPEKMGSLGGRTLAAASNRAAELARKHNADLVVYGKLKADDVESIFTPAFFLSPSKLHGAEELAGPYQLGGSINVVGDAVRNPAARAAIRIRLARRASAMTELLIGLGYNAVGRRDEALRRFHAARNRAPWNAQGHALLLQLAGNARGGMGDLEGAEHDYRAALAHVPGYARALYGLAELTYQRARGECSAATAHASLLKRASEQYKAVSTASTQPILAVARKVLTLKVAMGIGRVEYCAARAGADIGLLDGQDRFAYVASLGIHVPELRALVAEAHGYLGYLSLPARGAAQPRSFLRTARDHFRTASNLATTPNVRSDNLAALAFVLSRLGDRTGAARAYRSAAHYERDVTRRDTLVKRANRMRRP